MPSVVITGVSGSGKTLIGALLGQRIGAKLLNGDLMRPNKADDDDDGDGVGDGVGVGDGDGDGAHRLAAVRDAVASLERQEELGVIVCDAPKRSCRDAIRDGNTNVRFVFLDGTAKLISEQMLASQGRSFGPAIQLDGLQRPDPNLEQDVLCVSIDSSPEEIISNIMLWLLPWQRQLPSTKPPAEDSEESILYFDSLGLLRNKQTGMMIDTDTVMSTPLGTVVLPYVTKRVEEKMTSEYGLVRHAMLSADGGAHCDIFVSSNVSNCQDIFMIVTTYLPGIWCRGLVINDGIGAGSMLNMIGVAIDAGYGIVVLNPKGCSEKASQTPEQHIVSVWETIIEPVEGDVTFFGFEGGAHLIYHLLQAKRELIREPTGKAARIKAFVFMEPSASKPAPESDAEVDAFVFDRSIVIEQVRAKKIDSPCPITGLMPEQSRPCACTFTKRPEHINEKLIGYILHGVHTSVASTCVRLPLPENACPYAAVENMAIGITHTLDTVEQFLSWLADETTVSVVAVMADEFIGHEAKRLGLKPFQTNIGQLCDGQLVHSTLSERKKMRISMTSRLLGRLRSFGSAQVDGDDSVEEKLPSQHDESTQAITLDDFKLLRLMGEGSFGKLFLTKRRAKKDANMTKSSIWRRKKDKTYVMKLVFRDHIQQKNSEDELLSAKHPYLAQLRFIIRSPIKIFFLSDYFTGGCMETLLKSRQRGHFSFADSQFYAAEICAGVLHLHSLGIAHQSITLRNLLVDAIGHVHLSDFGLAKKNIYGKQATDSTATLFASPEYLAPELVNVDGAGLGGESKSADWWAVGVCLYKLLTGRFPFSSNKGRASIYQAIRADEVDFSHLHQEEHCVVHYLDEATSILTGLLQKEPEKRLGYNGNEAAIRGHPYFASFDWDKLLDKGLRPPHRPDLKRTSKGFEHGLRHLISLPPVSEAVLHGYLSETVDALRSAAESEATKTNGEGAAASDVVFEGWLTKRSVRSGWNWKKRWFTLFKEQPDNSIVLAYFKKFGTVSAGEVVLSEDTRLEAGGGARGASDFTTQCAPKAQQLSRCCRGRGRTAGGDAPFSSFAF